MSFDEKDINPKNLKININDSYSKNLKEIHSNMIEEFNNIQNIKKNTKLMISKISPCATDRSINSTRSNIEVSFSNTPRNVAKKINKPMNKKTKSQDFKIMKQKNSFLKNNIIDEIIKSREVKDAQDLKDTSKEEEVKEKIPLWDCKDKNTQFNIFTKTKTDGHFAECLNTESNEGENLKTSEQNDFNGPNDVNILTGQSNEDLEDEKIEVIFNGNKKNEEEKEKERDEEDYCENIIIKSNINQEMVRMSIYAFTLRFIRITLTKQSSLRTKLKVIRKKL